ncbi:MAG: site-specific DNA-methyltransferase [Candidatus Heimdallarchaeota archaeon]|nr:MAG: site-specific DNA-methyltransferase [Candidatus Heimdallarchaeota archaeon]
MEEKKRGKRTKTSTFGSPGREGHDSTMFYSSRLYNNLPNEESVQYIENPIPSRYLNKIFTSSSEYMEELPDNSIHLMVTSPPYNVGKDYDNNLTLKEYLAFLKRVWKEVQRVLVPSGRACINVANLGRKPYIPLHSFIINTMLEIGFLMRGEIIWDKSASAGTSTAWGSWMSPTNPSLRDVHEYILIFSKDQYKRETPDKRKSTITRDEFLELTKSVWKFSTESAKRIGHPAPFPVELPYRIIQLNSYENDIILDPFIGSGQTAIAAIKTNRYYIGYEIEENYVALAERRISEFEKTFNAPKLTDFMK